MGLCVYAKGIPPEGGVTNTDLQVLLQSADRISQTFEWGCESFAFPTDVVGQPEVFISTKLSGAGGDGDDFERDLGQVVALVLHLSRVCPQWLWMLSDDIEALTIELKGDEILVRNGHAVDSEDSSAAVNKKADKILHYFAQSADIELAASAYTTHTSTSADKETAPTLEAKRDDSSLSQSLHLPSEMSSSVGKTPPLAKILWETVTTNALTRDDEVRIDFVGEVSIDPMKRYDRIVAHLTLYSAEGKVLFKDDRSLVLDFALHSERLAFSVSWYIRCSAWRESAHAHLDLASTVIDHSLSPPLPLGTVKLRAE